MVRTPGAQRAIDRLGAETRREFEMSEADLAAIKESCRPRPLMFLSGGMPMAPSTQESANAAWCALGRRMGFDGMTVKPVPGKGPRFFTAEPAPVRADTETKAAVASDTPVPPGGGQSGSVPAACAGLKPRAAAEGLHGALTAGSGHSIETKEVSSMKVKAHIVLSLAGSFEGKVVPLAEFQAKDEAEARKQLEIRARVEQGVQRDTGEKSCRAVYVIDSSEEVAEKGAQPA